MSYQPATGGGGRPRRDHGRARAQTPHRRAVSLSLGDVCDTQQPGASHDTVVDFGIIHHVPQWQQAIAVIARVLRPGGQLPVRRSPRYMHARHLGIPHIHRLPRGKPLRSRRIAAELARHGLHGTADRTTPRRTALRRSRPQDMAHDPTQTPASARTNPPGLAVRDYESRS